MRLKKRGNFKSCFFLTTLSRSYNACTLACVEYNCTYVNIAQYALRKWSRLDAGPLAHSPAQLAIDFLHNISGLLYGVQSI